MNIDVLTHYIEIFRILSNSTYLKTLICLYKYDNNRVGNIIEKIGLKRSTFYAMLHRLKRYGFIEHKHGHIKLTGSSRKLLEWITYGLNDYYGFRNQDSVIISRDKLKKLYLAASKGYYWLYLRGIITSREYRDFTAFLQEVKRLIE